MFYKVVFFLLLKLSFSPSYNISWVSLPSTSPSPSPPPLSWGFLLLGIGSCHLGMGMGCGVELRGQKGGEQDLPLGTRAESDRRPDRRNWNHLLRWLRCFFGRLSWCVPRECLLELELGIKGWVAGGKFGGEELCDPLERVGDESGGLDLEEDSKDRSVVWLPASLSGVKCFAALAGQVCCFFGVVHACLLCA